ncbi:hypothetical protein PMM47T1_24009 [Pseudomonas sp. M47T1]|uniref:hypothetical protein n=1 Tax=Pseudomonas sp. M47T1 TaxID=1179778 RepID=UPI00026068F4|nr:hypothetical protein [Pseudomonas sp. M47T1]EIK94014.1 hypothetical protein PMM47T1_24009 [Pseudomonas sp. M47T1]
MEADVNPTAELEGAALQSRLRLELPNEISAETVDPVVALLKDAPAGTAIELHLRHNAGGRVDKMVALIDALNETKASVEITYSRYIMSAAATVWLYFLLRSTTNVQSLMPRKPGVVMYHRPRKTQGDYLCFADEVGDDHPLKGPLAQQMKIFDDLFETMYQVFLRIGPDGQLRDEPPECMVHEPDGLKYRHWVMRLRDCYYGNQDCLIPV